MNRIALLRESATLLRNPATFGDGAVLKALAFSDQGSRRVREAMASQRGFIADLDATRLAALPAGSFGRAVYDLCQANDLTLLRPSATLRGLADERFVAVRYAATHDLVHVLIDEGTDYAGEAAVYAFSCAQGYSRVHWLALALGCLLWPLAAPRQAIRIWRGAARGYRKGRRSGLVLAHRFEDDLAEPLEVARRRANVVL
jgi:ubiquinone biosynthesis protein Coq4